MVISSKKEYSGESNLDELELPVYDFGTIAIATGNFSDENKLGQGGFGCVYKVIFLLTHYPINAISQMQSIPNTNTSMLDIARVGW